MSTDLELALGLILAQSLTHCVTLGKFLTSF